MDFLFFAQLDLCTLARLDSYFLRGISRLSCIRSWRLDWKDGWFFKKMLLIGLQFTLRI
jgi:hypothetical protein